MTHVLVVDDDKGIRDLLASYLQQHFPHVGHAANAAEARAYIASHNVNLMILDIMMPGETGLELTKSLVNSHNIPIILLTAKDTTSDRVKGLDFGADDYITKPFEPPELLARIKAVLRRAGAHHDSEAQMLEMGEYAFNRTAGQLMQADNVIHLSSSEAILLKTMAQSPHQPFSRADLAQRVGHRVSDRSIDVQITRLRKKIGDNPRQPKYIQTVRHIGYALCPD